MRRGERSQEHRDRERDSHAGERDLEPAGQGSWVRLRCGLRLIDQVGAGGEDESEDQAGDDRLAEADPGVDQGHPAQDAHEIGATTEHGEFDRERPGGQQDREPGGDHRAEEHSAATADRAADRCVDDVAADRADQTHVHEVRPQRGQSAVSKKEALDDQHRRDHHRARPRAEHHGREDASQEMPRDGERTEREIYHLRREHERRHRAHQHGGSLAQSRLDGAEAVRQPRKPQNARREGNPRVKYGVGDVHGQEPRGAAARRNFANGDDVPLKVLS